MSTADHRVGLAASHDATDDAPVESTLVEPATLAAAGAARRARGSGGGGAAYNYVGVDYLTSFERMGRARLRCAEVPGGCTCAPRTLDAHTREHASVRRVAYLRLGGAGLANCVVELTTLDRSSSGGFKWKLVRLSVGLALE